MKNAPKEAPQQIAAMLEVIHHAKSDPLPSVAAWASKCEVELMPPKVREVIIRDMVEDADWRHRQLAVLMLDAVDPATRDELLAKLVRDPQASVRADAKTIKGILSLPPTTMPTSMPTSGPTTGPTPDQPTTLPLAPTLP
jgi:hypothetical protein